DVVDGHDEDASALGGRGDGTLGLGVARGCDDEPRPVEVRLGKRTADPLHGKIRAHLVGRLGRDDTHARAGFHQLGDLARRHGARADDEALLVLELQEDRVEAHASLLGMAGLSTRRATTSPTTRSAGAGSAASLASAAMSASVPVTVRSSGKVAREITAA